MSRSVDERVVQMKFDNRDFENKVKESVGSLEKLKSSLDFSKSGKGVSQLQNNFDKIDVTNLNKAISSISDHFTFLGRVSDQVIRRIADGFANLTMKGLNFVKSLSVDQITAGWGKYESKTESIQTIMNATGASIDEVNYYLDKMMWFSDETSYGFTDMASALGQMTSAGGEMEKLVPMIMGVANATAYAGKGPAEFTRAMYNLNQSYTSGALKYMDWKSLEMAGVASKQLKQTLIDTAVEMGKIKKGQVDLSNFNETLKDDWADQKVMEKAFGKFAMATEEAYKLVKESGEFDTASEAYEALAGSFDEVYYRAARAAQEAKSFKEAIDSTKDAVSSGWMKSFELIFGNYEEAKVLWTDMANAFWEIFALSGESRNELLEEWHDAQVGGYKDFAETINILLESIIEAKDNLGNIVYDILPDIDTPNLMNFVMKFKELAKEAKAFFTGDMPKFEGISAELAKTLGFASKKDALASLLPDAQARYDKAITNGKYFKQVVAGAAAAVNILRKGLITLHRSLSPLLKIVSALWSFGLKVLAGLSHVIRFLDQSTEATDGFRGVVDDFATTISDALEVAGDAIYDFFNAMFYWDQATDKWIFAGGILDLIQKKFDEMGQSELGKNIVDALAGIRDIGMIIIGGLQWVFDQIPKAFPYIISGLETIAGWAAKGVGYIGQLFSSAKDWLVSTNFSEFASGIWQSVKEFITPATERVKTFFATLTAEKVKQDFQGILSFLGQAFHALGQFLQPVLDVLKELWGYITAGNFEGFKNLMNGLLQGGGLIALLRLSKSGSGFIETFLGIGEAIEDLLNRFAGKERIGSIILKIAIGIAILTASLWSLSGLNPDQIINASVALGSLFFILTTFVKSLDKISSAGMLSGEKRGLFGTAKTFFTSPLSQISTDLIKMGIALMFFAKAIKILAGIDSKGLTNAITTLGMLFLMIGIFSKVMNSFSKASSAMVKGKGGGGLGGLLMKVGLAVALIGAGLLLFAGAVKLLGTMDEKAIWAASTMVLLFVAAFTALAVIGDKFSNGLNNLWKTLLAGAVAMLIAAPAIMIFTGCIAALSLLPIGNVVVATLALTGLIAGLAFAVKNFNLKSAASLLMIALGVRAIAGAISLIGGMEIGQVVLGVGGLAVTLLALSLTLKRLSIKNAEVFMTLALGIMAMGFAMQILGNLEWEQILKALVSILGLMTIFKLFNVSMMSGSATGIRILSGALGGFALALLAVSVALTALALIGKEKGRQLLADIRDLAPDLQKTIVTLVGTTCGAITGAFPIILDTIGILLNDFIDWLTKAIEGPDGLIAQLFGLLVGTIQSLADWLNDENNRKDLIDAISNLVDAVVSTCFEFAAKMAEKIPFVGGAIAGALRDVEALFTGKAGPNIKDLVDIASGTYVFSAASDSIRAGFGGGSATTGKEKQAPNSWAGEMYESDVRYTRQKERSQDESISVELINSLLTGYKDKSLTDSNIESMGKSMTEQELQSIGTTLGSIYGELYESGNDDDVLALMHIEDILTEVYRERQGVDRGTYFTLSRRGNAEDFRDPYYKIWETVDSKYAGKLVKDAAEEVAKECINSSAEAAFDAYYDLIQNSPLEYGLVYWFFPDDLKNYLYREGIAIGQEAGNGLVAGLEQHSNSVKNAAKNVATTAISTMKSVLGIKSPSKVGAEIGEFWDLGLANGIRDSYPVILKATNNNAQGMITAMGLAASELVDNFTSAYSDINAVSLNPIRPIVSLDSKKAISHLGAVMDNQQSKTAYVGNRKSNANNNTKDAQYNTKNYGDFTINVYASEGQNPKDIAAYVMDEIQSEMERREAALA